MSSGLRSPGTSKANNASAGNNVELTENIHLMRLVHEFKASFPTVPDEFVKKCVLQNGKNRERCVELLRGESDRLAQGGTTRRFSLQGQLQGRHQDDRAIRRRDSVQLPLKNLTNSPSAEEPRERASPTLSVREPCKRAKRRFSDFGVACASCEVKENEGGHVPPCSVVPTVVLTKGSPPPGDDLRETAEGGVVAGVETLFQPPGPTAADDNFVILGRASNLTAVCLDFEQDALNNNNKAAAFSDGGSSVLSSSSSSSSSYSSSGVDGCKQSSSCSLSTTTLSQGELKLVRSSCDNAPDHDDASDRRPCVVTSTAFTTVSRDTISVSATAGGKQASHPVFTKTSTSSTVFWNKNNGQKKPASADDRRNSHKNNHGHFYSNQCPENPFRKVFAQRKQFYQDIAERNNGAGVGSGTRPSASSSSVNRLLLRKRHCALCCAENRSCSNPASHAHAATQSEQVLQEEKEEEKRTSLNSKITLNADIQPFAPFTITHDGVSDGLTVKPQVEPKFGGGGLDRSISSSSLDHLTRRLLLPHSHSDGEIKVDSDGALHYAASAINSEEGVESRLEVSVGADGRSVVTTTRHKRLGSPSEISNNSVVRVQYEEGGGKVVKIQHSQRKTFTGAAGGAHPLVCSASGTSLAGLLPPPPSQPAPPLIFDPLAGDDRRAGSAYCTQVAGGGPPFLTAMQQQEQSYNSLPNLYGRIPPFPVAMDEEQQHDAWQYNSHPADEQKRLAFTRELLSHQMRQRMNLEKELRLEREALDALNHEVNELEKEVVTKDMLRLKTTEEGGGSKAGRKKKGEMVRRSAALERDIEQLQESCDKMVKEVTLLTGGTVPLGETSIEFYESLRPAANAAVSNNVAPPVPARTSSRTSPQPPPRPSRPAPPPPPSSASGSTPLRLPHAATAATVVVGPEGPQWHCPECTFLNHPALDHCEECETPRINLVAAGPTGVGGGQHAGAADPCFCHPDRSTTPSAGSRRGADGT